jgi:hypothetical protein
MRSHHKGVVDTHLEVGEREICKEITGFKIMFGSVIPLRNHHKEDSMVVMRLRVGA